MEFDLFDEFIYKKSSYFNLIDHRVIDNWI